MNIEENRLSTFSSWPTCAVVEPSRIAKAGFFYTGQDFEVECFACGGKINDWNYGDQVMAKHRRLDPSCPFVTNPNLSGNIPKLSQSTSSSSESSETMFRSESARLRSFINWPREEFVSPESLARAGFYYLQKDDKVKCAFCDGICGFWEPGDEPKTEHKRHFPYCSFVLSGFSLKQVETPRNAAPKKPGYATLEARLLSFAEWDDCLIQTPGMLAEAGFYSTGIGDQVRCFQCDGGLRHWDPEDEPWVEHARWFPSCAYVISKKGEEFIRMHTPADNAPHFDRQIPQLSLEDQIEQDLNTAEAYLALSIGLPRDKIKEAIKNRLENLQMSYDDPDELINDTLNLQSEDGNPPHPEKGRNTEERSQSTTSNGRLAHNLQNIERTPNLLGNDLAEENRQLKEARLCKICLDNEMAIVFLPCGHLTACLSCAPNLKSCPVCRSTIKGSVRTFMS